MTDDRMIAALRRERDGYERRGLDERVAQVDEQLIQLGWEPDAEPLAPPAGDAQVPAGRTADSGQQNAARSGTAEAPAAKPARGGARSGAGGGSAKS
ncbi:hypothetical protein [Kitasatospora purpeofusca]|uniref:hypothetical protein n=1 Tax=Kitasatospora purpeofusca TaxID=67352 RepID=UPI002256DC5E|nr:hypothetical protein [Kitasatospora purpeofusca]MCX4752896.1 hypothetical protein [Kitasatospora purpeofusca]WSR32440.1 hypothetical protein OG715_16490 [Kitasatospora purpeofusca]WSR40527.1 hypothetical protein OG196_16270 [Kitasatospora purpeofusca]